MAQPNSETSKRCQNQNYARRGGSAAQNGVNRHSTTLVAPKECHDVEDYLHGAVSKALIGYAASKEQWDMHRSGPSLQVLAY